VLPGDDAIGDGFRMAPNRPTRSFTADQPTADIVHIQTAEGWRCSAGVMDLYAKAIVNWLTTHRINRDIVLWALLMTISARRRGELARLNESGVHQVSRFRRTSAPRITLIYPRTQMIGDDPDVNSD